MFWAHFGAKYREAPLNRNGNIHKYAGQMQDKDLQKYQALPYYRVRALENH
jgi:hypothetical protein